MPKTRRGLDRIKVASLRGHLRFAEENLKQHKTICADCSLYENTARHACDDGWQMLKAVSRAKNVLDIYTGVTAGGKQDTQGVLF